MVEYIGKTFKFKSPWGRQERWILDQVQQQVDQTFPGRNLIINLTWFGPQFGNETWTQVQQLIAQGVRFDRLFWVSAVDPVCISQQQMDHIGSALADQIFQIGTSLGDGPYEFNTGAIACLDDFAEYTEDQIVMQDFQKVYLCYNRKPKPHRIRMVELLLDNNLESYGTISLGTNDTDYDVSKGVQADLYLNPEQGQSYDYTRNGYFHLNSEFGGVPWDLATLGPLPVWQQHFLNIVSETVELPWDHTFVTEKTWKPIIGMRPFVINGQTTVYQWLRDRGFRTFNHLWPVELEKITETEVQGAIVNLVKYLSTVDIPQLYQELLPDLQYNRARFFEYAQEQKLHVLNLFK